VPCTSHLHSHDLLLAKWNGIRRFS
jgi:hypothetical protein